MLFFLACMPKKSPPTPLNKAEMQEVIEPPTVVLKLDNLEGVEVEGEMTLSMEATEEDLGEIGNLHRDFQKFLIFEYGDVDEKNAETIVFDKKDEMLELTERSLALIEAQKNYPEVSAGVYIGGATELHYAEIFLRYPIPSGLSAIAHVVFQERQLEYVVELKEGGRYRLETLVKHALQNGIRGGWEEEALRTLNFFYPLDFPLVHSTSLSVLDGNFARLRMVERSSLWRPEQWPKPKEERQALLEEVLAFEVNQAAWMTACHQIQADLAILDPDSELYCLGHNYVRVLDFLHAHPKRPPRVREAMELYTTAMVELLEQFPLDESGSFWKNELEKEYRAEQRQEELSKSLKGDEAVANIDWVDPKWEYGSDIETERHQNEIIMHHLEVHAHRIHYHTEQLRKKLERGFGSPDFLLNQVPKKLQAFEDDAAWVLSWYPEEYESHDRILMSLGALHQEYARALLRGIGRVDDDEIIRLLELESKSKLQAHRFLSLVVSREGDGTRWSSKSALLLR